MLHRYLDLISFHRKDTAFIIAVSSGAGTAEDFEAVCLEAGRQRIHLLPTADAERDVRVPGAGGRLRLVGHPGFVHQLQACAVRESEKVGAEVRPRVVVARIRHGVKIAYKEVLCGFKVVDVQGDVLDFPSVSFLCFTR